MDRIDSESEHHRTARALALIDPAAALPLPRGDVTVRTSLEVAASAGGQRLVVMLAHLLLRMKGLVRRVSLDIAGDVPVCPGIPIEGTSLVGGLVALAESINHSASTFTSALEHGDRAGDVTVAVGFPPGGADINVGSDAWCALLGTATAEARWADASPVGPYLAACIAAAEVFKRIVRLNLGASPGRLLTDLRLSLFNHGVGAGALPGPDIAALTLDDLAIAGCGAGGTAALYSLISIPDVRGEVGLVEPGRLKSSNLNRYLMSTAAQVHASGHKLDSINEFLGLHAAGIVPTRHKALWAESDVRAGRVVCAVDTPEARRDVQRSEPSFLVEAGTLDGFLYTVLRVVPGGWCLDCKHPYDPDVTWKKRAARWGLDVSDVKRRTHRRVPVTPADVERLSQVQGRPAADFYELVGVPFDELPTLTECGATPLQLEVPSQAPVLPMASTAAGVALAAEVIKNQIGAENRLSNWFVHDLRYDPRGRNVRFRPSRQDCPRCTTRDA